VAILLNKLNNESFKIVHDLVFPEDINAVEYLDLTAKLNNYYTKPTTVYGERLKFYETAMESVFEWNSKLKEATSNCKFGLNLLSKMKQTVTMEKKQ
jgi:hypothetical protein